MSGTSWASCRLMQVFGKPVALNYGLPCLNVGLLWSIVACFFLLLGFLSSLKSGSWSVSKRGASPSTAISAGTGHRPGAFSE